MSDNTELNPGTGGDVARTKDRTTTKTQVVGADINVYGAEILGGGRDLGNSQGGAQYVDNRASVGVQAQNSASLTTSVTAYVAGDQLGAILTFPNMVRVSGGTGRITGAVLLDKAKVIGSVDLFLYDRSVTLAADNGVGPGVSDADAANMVGLITVGATADANNYTASVHSISVAYTCNATSLFVAMVTRVGHTFFGAATDLVLKLFYELD